MRWILWAGVLLLACGKTVLQGPGDTGTGGMPATGGAGAGTGGVAGSGGAAGAGGAVVLGCQGEYTACDCGCCGGVTPASACYYPENGDSLAAIESADQAVAADRASCATEGCSLGRRYLCCATPTVAEAGTYLINGVSSDVQHLWIQRTVGNRCTSLLIKGLLRSTTTLPQQYALDLPTGLTYEGASDGDCGSQASPARPVIGAIGSVRATSDQVCAFAFDFTLFFQADDGSVDAERFQSDSVPLPPSPGCGG